MISKQIKKLAKNIVSNPVNFDKRVFMYGLLKLLTKYNVKNWGTSGNHVYIYLPVPKNFTQVLAKMIASYGGGFRAEEEFVISNENMYKYLKDNNYTVIPKPNLVANPWVLDDDGCWIRYVKGGNIHNLEDRVAFIEKTPRIRVLPFTDVGNDYLNWESGPKGDYLDKDGYSRNWCDQELKRLGYTLL